MQEIGLDFSKEAIQIGSINKSKVCWVVSDITNITKIPLKSHNIDCILNFFTPANYSEFTRLLTKKGIIIKVVLFNNHLLEL